MKKNLMMALLLVVCQLVVAQSEASPLSVGEALKKSDNSATEYWVEGYVVGEYSAYSNSKYFYEMAPPFAGEMALLIADSPNELNPQRCMALQFPGSAYIDEYNLEENPECWHRKLKVCGLLRSYMNLKGVKTISNFKWGVESREHELWNIAEDFDDDDLYIPASETSMFAGGIYRSEQLGDLKIVGGTYGSTSGDNKWGKASIKLRYTEATQGDKGTMTTVAPLANGVGEVRFWAGNYKDDAAMQLAVSVQYSTDGTVWHEAENIEVARGKKITTNGMTEYAVEINQSGNVWLRLAKSDDEIGGVCIDRMRVSDFDESTSSVEIANDTRWLVWSGNSRLMIKFETPNHALQVYNATGMLCYSNNSAPAGVEIQLKRGFYLVRSEYGVKKIMVK